MIEVVAGAGAAGALAIGAGVLVATGTAVGAAVSVIIAGIIGAVVVVVVLGTGTAPGGGISPGITITKSWLGKTIITPWRAAAGAIVVAGAAVVVAGVGAGATLAVGIGAIAEGPFVVPGNTLLDMGAAAWAVVEKLIATHKVESIIFRCDIRPPGKGCTLSIEDV